MPSLLFPALCMLLLAYTNRFLALAGVIRNLCKDDRQAPEPSARCRSWASRPSGCRWALTTRLPACGLPGGQAGGRHARAFAPTATAKPPKSPACTRRTSSTSRVRKNVSCRRRARRSLPTPPSTASSAPTTGPRWACCSRRSGAASGCPRPCPSSATATWTLPQAASRP
nr:DUF2721 domain-containing protein [Crenobacter caeni]